MESATLPLLKTMSESMKVSLRCSLFRSSRNSGSFKSRSCPNTADLISRENWYSLRAFLRTNDGVAEVYNSMRKSDLGARQSLLHFACQFHPPLDVVKMLVEEFPDTLLFEDSDGRTPLHVAAAFGASPQVIDFLIELDDSAASKQDSKGKTPLHLSCESCILERKCDSGCRQGTIKGPMISVIKSLYAAAPSTVNIEDHAGMSPLEYAIIHDADRKIVRVLQKASEKEWKIMKKSEQEILRASFITSSIGKKSFFDVSTGKLNSKHGSKSISKRRHMRKDIRLSSCCQGTDTWIPSILPSKGARKRSSYTSEAA